MEQVAVEIFATIKGISAASGLFLLNDLLYVVGDNSNYLYEYHLSEKHINRIKLIANATQFEQIPKAAKADFEVLCHHDGILYILGSGSTAKRNRMVSYHLREKKTMEHDLSQLYSAMKKAHAIDDDNLNIEGAIFTGEQWLLFNRGNGTEMKNGVFIIKDAKLANANSADFVSIPIAEASFTDAVCYRGQIYFLAAAEDTTSTYDDGKIMGSFLGSLDLSTLKLNYLKKISDHQKFEGLTFYRQHASKIELLICEDADSELTDTLIYKLTI